MFTVLSANDYNIMYIVYVVFNIHIIQDELHATYAYSHFIFK